jgi:hypothetical protein
MTKEKEKKIITFICGLIILFILGFGIVNIIRNNVGLKVRIETKKKDFFFKVGKVSNNFEILEVY